MRFFTNVDQTEVQDELSNTYIFLLYALIMFVINYLANWPWRWTMLHKNCERTHGVIKHYVMVLMKHGVIKLHNHLHSVDMSMMYSPQ